MEQRKSHLWASTFMLLLAGAAALLYRLVIRGE